MMQLIESTKEMSRDSRFLRKVLMITYPVVLQGILNTVVNLVGTLMIGTMEATTIATVGLANKFFFVFSLLVFGIAGGSGVLAAQSWGSSDLRSIRRVLGLSTLLALTGALFFVVPALMSPQSVMRILTTNHNNVELEVKYLKTAVLTYPFLAMTNVYVAILRAVGKVIFPAVSSCIVTLINICLNYVLIFGKFGTPTTGVSDATVATLITRTIEIVLILGYVYGKELLVACELKGLSGWSGLFISQFFRTSAPVIANKFMWRLGTTMYSLAYGRMGDEAVTVITIATTIQGILVVLFQGLSATTTVILGDELGAGHLKRAEKYMMHFFILQFIATIGMAVMLIGIRRPIIGLCDITPEVARDVGLCILIFAACMPTKIFNYASVVDMLRGGGGTRMCLFLDTSGMWFISVPLAFLGALAWRLPIYTVYALVTTKEVYKAVLGYVRYRQKRQLRNLATRMG